MKLKKNTQGKKTGFFSLFTLCYCKYQATKQQYREGRRNSLQIIVSGGTKSQAFCGSESERD
jgi:hypothetical protein